MSVNQTILGVDPGSRRAGFSWVRCERGRIVDLQLGTWDVPARGDSSQRLALLWQQADQFLSQNPIDVAIVESMFHHRNVRSALTLAQARGVLIAAIGQRGIPLVEYPPATIKKSVCGHGAADKAQVRRCLGMTVPGVSRQAIQDAAEDATDALAAVVCHLSHRQTTVRGASW